MSQVIDLMPEACRIRLGRRAWVRGWIVRYTVAAIALVVVISGTEIREQAKRSRVAALQKQVDFSVEQKKKAEALQAKIAAYEAALDQHDALALPLTVGTALQTLASCTPVSVTLTSLAMLPKTVRDRTVKPGEQGKENRWLLFELRGVSPSDTDLAQFLAALESDVIFSRATVDYTTQKDIYGIEAREFGITCEIDLERDFVFDEGVTP